MWRSLWTLFASPSSCFHLAGWQLFIIFSDTCLSKRCRVATSVASVQQPAMRPLADLLVNSTAPTQQQQQTTHTHTQTQSNSNFQMIYETLHIISECVYHFFSLWKNLGTGDVDKWQKTALRPFMPRHCRWRRCSPSAQFQGESKLLLILSSTRIRPVF